MLSGTIMATKPVKTIKTAANIYDNDNDFEVVQVVNPKKSKI